MSGWSSDDIGDQAGRVAFVTGANGGLGLETSSALASKGATVVMAGRDQARIEAAATRVRSKSPGAEVTTVRCDLASLASIRSAASETLDRHPRIDMLFNNAGVMAVPRSETVDGFESQFGINHLGHFALVGLLMPALGAGGQSRVVTTTSAMRRWGKLRFEDLNATRSYGRWSAYSQSKFANMVFVVELERRLSAAGVDAVSVGAHPGYAATGLQNTDSYALKVMFGLANFVAQSAAAGAWPQLYAATSPDVVGGTLFGPRSFGGMRGHPRAEMIERAALDPVTAGALWDASVEATGVDYLQQSA